MDMDNEGTSRTRGKRSQPHAAIVFGTAAAAPVRRPASVRATCEAIGLARSTYYYQSHRSSGAIALEQQIVQRLLELREAHPDDGYRRMTKHLQLEGLHVNRKRIARLMQLHNLGVRTSQQEGSSLRHRLTMADSVAQHDSVSPRAANQVWISDLAYVHIGSGLIYAAAIIDVWSREVVGYAASTHINPRLPALALHSAVRARRPVLGCVHRSTYGMQYLMRGYQALLRQYGLIQVAHDASEALAPGASLCGATPSGRHLVEMSNYATWDEVTLRSEEFIRALYSRERIEAILLAQGKATSRELEVDRPVR